MQKKIKNIISQIDLFLFKIFGSDKSIKFLKNIKEAKIIFSYLNDIGGESKIRFVGGCVRKVLCGERSDDIDLATYLEPEEVKKKLAESPIKVIDTGITHGTVTAILNKKKFEITTLRKDVLTDGRHAKVNFTSNWKEDALRRDFTINSIYADIEGRIFDPLNGISDLKLGKINFIGSPEKRIQEDYLRILRYFRFFTQYSKVEHEEETIKSIKKNINGINKISNERIFDELKKILYLKNFFNLFNNNTSKEIILSIFPQLQYFERLKKIEKLGNLKEKYESNLILALLIVDQSNNYEYFCHKYKIPNKTKNRLKNISDNFENLKKKNFYLKENIKRLIYFIGKNNVIDLLLFSISINNKIDSLTIERLLEYVNDCEIPKFPITGNYLIKHGYKSDQTLGKKLESLKEQWIKNNFVIDNEVVQKSLSKINHD
jgi:tRNA nucleotidyltransferase/poly(A) polymerase